MRIHPGLSLLATLACAAALQVIFPTAIEIPLLPRIATAVVAFLVGGALLSWAIHTLQTADTSVEPHGRPSAIIVSGPFRFSRNPMYLANLLFSIGFVGITSSAWFVVGTAVQFLLLNYQVIPAEEAVLKQVFPDASAAWFSRTRRWM